MTFNNGSTAYGQTINQSDKPDRQIVFDQEQRMLGDLPRPRTNLDRSLELGPSSLAATATPSSGAELGGEAELDGETELCSGTGSGDWLSWAVSASRLKLL